MLVKESGSCELRSEKILEMPSDVSILTTSLRIMSTAAKTGTSTECNGSGDIWYIDGAKGGELTGAELYRHEGAKETNVPLGQFPTAIQAEMINIIITARATDYEP